MHFVHVKRVALRVVLPHQSLKLNSPAHVWHIWCPGNHFQYNDESSVKVPKCLLNLFVALLKNVVFCDNYTKAILITGVRLLRL